MIYTTPVVVPSNCPNGQCYQTASTVSVDQTKAQIVFRVPTDASIYLVGQKMTVTGEVRTFNSPVLQAGQKFGYPIRVEVTRDGKTFKAEGTQLVRAGDRVELEVELNTQLGQLYLSQVDGQKSVLDLVQAGAEQAQLVSQK